MLLHAGNQPKLIHGGSGVEMSGRHGKRRRSRRCVVVRRWRWMAILLAVCSFGWLALLRISKMATWQRASSGSESGAKALINPPSETKTALALEANRKWPVRVGYPYSVVPAGVRSVEDLKNAITCDPVVAADYASFALSSAPIIRLDRDRSIHVFYRLGGQVDWMKKELKLEKGETLITDGVHTALTRCGNLISETVSDLVFPNEPTAQEMDASLPPDTGIQTSSNVPPDPPGTLIPAIPMPPIENDPVIVFPPGPPGVLHGPCRHHRHMLSLYLSQGHWFCF
jgi:hypothetical protein